MIEKIKKNVLKTVFVVQTNNLEPNIDYPNILIATKGAVSDGHRPTGHTGTTASEVHTALQTPAYA